jgi:exonuclease III
MESFMCMLLLVACLLLMDSAIHQYKMLSWNVKGLNSHAKQGDIRQVINNLRPDLVCLQETKIAYLNTQLVRNVLGPNYEDNYVSLPAQGTMGGIIIATNISMMKFSNPSTTGHIVSALVQDIRCTTPWMVSGVYGHQGDLDKKIFVRELKHLNQGANPAWMVIGDFNMICN